MPRSTIEPEGVVTRLRTKSKMSRPFSRFLEDQYGLTTKTSVVDVCSLRQLPAVQDFGVGVVVGSSGSGKSTTLRKFKPAIHLQARWTAGKSVMEHFASAEEAEELLFAVALNNIPDWRQSYDKLSTGQKFRADIARLLVIIKRQAKGLNRGRQTPKYFLIDEFASTLDTNSAKAIAYRLHRFVKKHQVKGIVLGTLNEDILPFLRPDWVLYTDTCKYEKQPAWPKVSLQIKMVHIRGAIMQEWRRFQRFHYLSHGFTTASRCFLVYCNGEICGFHCCVRNMRPKNFIIAHRTVVLPAFQGFGIGSAIHELMGAYVKRISRDKMKFRVITSHKLVVASMLGKSCPTASGSRNEEGQHRLTQRCAALSAEQCGVCTSCTGRKKCAPIRKHADPPKGEVAFPVKQVLWNPIYVAKQVNDDKDAPDRYYSRGKRTMNNFQYVGPAYSRKGKLENVFLKSPEKHKKCVLRRTIHLR